MTDPPSSSERDSDDVERDSGDVERDSNGEPTSGEPAGGVDPTGETAAHDSANLGDGDGIVDSATIKALPGETPATPYEKPGKPGEMHQTGGSADAARAGTLVGQTLAGRYHVLELIGRGGMSVVYRARHELLKKTFAVKVLREALATNKESLTRFHREAMAAASIGDPHIVDITDYGFTERGDAFIVMESLDGCNLRQLVNDEGAQEVGRCVAIARQILRALAAAHDRGIIHRDLKAENVFITQREGRDFVKLLDFGISKLTQPAEGEDETGLTSTGQVMGTPQYLAPEQAQGIEKVDHRVDIYAMGVILYEMLTGELPFTGKSVFDLVMKHVQEPPQPPSERRPDLAIPDELERVVLRALGKKPEHRFDSAEAMLAALPGSDALPGGFPSGTLADAVAPGQQSRPRGNMSLVWLALVGIVLLVLGGLIWRRFFSAAETPVVATAADARPLPADASAPPADTTRPDHKPRADASTVQVKIVVAPARARVFIDGELVGRGSQTVNLPVGSQRQLRVTAPGFLTHTSTLSAEESQTLNIRLRRPAGKQKTKGRGDLDDNPYGR